MIARTLALLAFACCVHAVARATDLPDYVRYTEDARAARLEVAIRSFSLPTGQRVDLVGAIHIADRSYYQDLNGRFAAYDAVLFERLASRVLYTDASLRATSESTSTNTLGQDGLWPLSISGDLPILLVRVVEEDDLPLARQVLQAQEYWRLKGLAELRGVLHAVEALT